MAGSEIYQLLERDHREVERMFQQILASKGGQASGGSTAESLFDTLSMEIQAHMTAEEETFYSPLSNKNETRDSIAEGYKEHREIRSLLKEVKGTPGSESWLAKLKEVQKEVDHHVEEEEGKVFKGARQVLSKDQAVEIGARFEQKKQQTRQKAA